MERSRHNNNIFRINQCFNCFNYDRSSTVLSIENSIYTLTLNGSYNKVYIYSKVPNLIINGHNNKIISEGRHNLSNVVINGRNNNIKAPQRNFHHIVNDFNNIINDEMQSNNINMYNNFRNSSFNININDREADNFSVGIQNLMNMVSNLVNNNNNQQRNFSYDNNFNNYYYNSEQREEDEEQTEVNDNEDNERRERDLMNKRKEKILELNEYQFKHADKYIKRIEDKCAICLEKFQRNDMIKQFSCEKHIFHSKCLKTWLKKSNLCPLCKENLMKNFNCNKYNK